MFVSQGTVLELFSARIMRIKTKQKSCYISVDNDLEMGTRLIKSLVLQKKKSAILVLSNNIKISYNESILAWDSHWSSLCSLD